MNEEVKMPLVEIVGHILKVVSITNMCSGLPASIRMWRTGRTEGVPVLFFVIGLLGALSLTHYGLIVDNFTLILLNGIGVVLNSYYVISFLCNVKDKGSTLLMVLGGTAYIGMLYGYAAFAQLSRDSMIDLLGSTSTVVFLVMNCVPILDVMEAYNKQRASFDLIMLGAGMLNCTLWLVYGLLLEDPYLYIPGLPFLASGIVKVAQITIYSSSSAPTVRKRS